MEKGEIILEWKDRVLNRFSKQGSAIRWNDMYNSPKKVVDLHYILRRDYTANTIDDFVKSGDFESSSAKILDLGCGAGPLIASLAERGIPAVGVDYSFDMVKLASTEVGEVSSNSVNLLQANCEQLPFEDNYFDCVICLGLISFLEEIEPTIKEVQRILKPGGLMVISFRNTFREIAADPYQLLRFSIRKLAGKSNKSEASDMDIGKYFNPLDIEQTLQKIKFPIQKHRGIGFGPIKLYYRTLLPVSVSLKISRLMDNLFRILGSGLLPKLICDINIYNCINRKE